jgi:membrane protein required for colicin V production
MILDMIYIILIVWAVWTGLRRGLIVAVFSLLAIIIGLAAALKLSAVTAAYIGTAAKVSEAWLPVISFSVVFIIVYLLVRWGASLIERTAEFALAGWINRLGGAVFFIAVYTMVWSVLLFYADQKNILTDEVKQKSLTWSFVQPWGPQTINSLGGILPFFSNMFSELENFFGKLSEKIPPPR